ncbi:integrase core domain-containing protein [Rhodoferax sp.]|uniref:integrase core domain-containing protein n=1 Tax=Rhodoferax sp. TaxID=50421 RepID=UPI0039B9C0CD
MFTATLRCFGIRHQLIDRGCPWQNGRIERFFGTLKQSLNHWAVGNRAQLQLSLEVFRDWYCCVRPHANLNGATPWEAWCGNDASPDFSRSRAPEQVAFHTGESKTRSRITVAGTSAQNSGGSIPKKPLRPIDRARKTPANAVEVQKKATASAGVSHLSVWVGH